MVRKHTPEELAETNRLLKEAQPLLSDMNRKERDEIAMWQAEIAMLERRTNDEFMKIDLGHGDIILCRACPSEAETREINQLRLEIQNGDQDKIYRIAEIVTANPLITEQYLKENPTKWCTYDLLQAITGFFEEKAKRLQEERERVTRADAFRTNEGR